MGGGYEFRAAPVSIVMKAGTVMNPAASGYLLRSRMLSMIKLNNRKINPKIPTTDQKKHVQIEWRLIRPNGVASERNAFADNHLPVSPSRTSSVS